MQETLVWSLDWEDATEKRMATHSSILAWRIPQTEEPAGLQSIGSPSVRHDWMTNFSSKAISNFPSSLAESLKFCVLPFQALHQLPWALLPLQGTLNMLYPMSQPHPVCSVFPFFFCFCCFFHLDYLFCFCFCYFLHLDYPFFPISPLSKSYSGPSLVVQMVKNLSTMQETWVWSWVRKIPWRREWQPTPVFLPGEAHGQRSLVGNNPWGC